MREEATYTHRQTTAMAEQRQTTMSMQKTGSQHIPCCFPIRQVFIWRVSGKINWKHDKGIWFSYFVCDLISYWMSLWAWQRRKGRGKNTSFIVELGKFLTAFTVIWNYPSANRLIWGFFLFKEKLEMGRIAWDPEGPPGFWIFAKSPYILSCAVCGSDSLIHR